MTTIVAETILTPFSLVGYGAKFLSFCNYCLGELSS